MVCRIEPMGHSYLLGRLRACRQGGKPPCGLWIRCHAERPSGCLRQRLSPHHISRVFDAEAVGALRGLEAAIALHNGSQLWSCVDSTSVIWGLRGTAPASSQWALMSALAYLATISTVPGFGPLSQASIYSFKRLPLDSGAASKGRLHPTASVATPIRTDPVLDLALPAATFLKILLPVVMVFFAPWPDSFGVNVLYI